MHRPAELYGDFGRPIYLKGSERGKTLLMFGLSGSLRGIPSHRAEQILMVGALKAPQKRISHEISIFKGDCFIPLL